MCAQELFEHRPAYLYHGTSVAHALEALRDDRLNAYGVSISLTRSQKVAEKFADKSADVLEIWMNDWAELFRT